MMNLQIPHHTDPAYNPMRSLPSPLFSIDALSVNFNANAGGFDLESLCDDLDLDVAFDAFSGDHFRMFEFKIRKCARARSHDWTECPYAHPGEKARRRDPRRHHYSGTACAEFRKGNCKKGESCEFAHGVFECWLHPSRYRTQFCKDLTNCRRRVCFFAHNPDQLRILVNGSGTDSSDGSPSPTSVLNSSAISDSPPMSPGNQLYGVNEIATSMRNVQIDDKMASTRAFQMGSVYGSPRGSIFRPGFFSLPSTPNRVQKYLEEPAMERVESGRELRAKIYAKLSKENSFGVSASPDFGVY